MLRKIHTAQDGNLTRQMKIEWLCEDIQVIDLNGDGKTGMLHQGERQKS